MYQTIPIQYLDDYLERGFDGRLVDLRDAVSYRCAHILGAENIPFDNLICCQSKLSAGETVMFYCLRGSESLLACNYFSGKGFHVINVANGLSQYRGKYLVAGSEPDGNG